MFQHPKGGCRICDEVRAEEATKPAGSITWIPPNHDAVAPAEPPRLTKFDDAIKVVTDQRGSVYGHPRHDFDRADRLKAVVAECKDPLARHALEMICVKVARLIQTPAHLDSWIDIAGYARTGVMVTEK